jgi:hypothetical protein
MSRDIELQSLEVEVKNLLEDVAELREIIQESPMWNEANEHGLFLIEETYENLRNRMNAALEELGIEKRVLLTKQIFDLGTDLEEVDSLDFLRRIQTQGDKARVILEGLQKRVVLTSDKEKELETVKDEIAKTIEPIAPLYARDLQKSLAEFSEGHLLSSVLIAGRVMDVLMDKVEKASGGPTIEAQLDFLKTEKIVDKETEGYVVRAVKNYRNIYSHTVGSSPEIEDCLITILGTSKLLKNVIKSQHPKLRL